MTDHRLYGTSPYKLVLVHGGPGAPGTLAPLARELSPDTGVIEALQTATTLQGQIEELHRVIREHGSSPVTLLGHSWGAWLALLTARHYPGEIEKVIIVGAGPLEDKYLSLLTRARMERLDRAGGARFESLLELLQRADTEIDPLLDELDAFLFVTDNYQPVVDSPAQIEHIPTPVSLYQGVWQEAASMRSKDELLSRISGLKVPVIALHGRHDPHPLEGVSEPLHRVLRDFKMIALENCGHNPWLEKEARQDFYQHIRQILTSMN